MIAYDVLILFALIVLIGMVFTALTVLAFWFGSYGARRLPRENRARH
jgi:hypothetical protein